MQPRQAVKKHGTLLLLLCSVLAGAFLLVSCGESRGGRESTEKIPLPDMGPETPYEVIAERGLAIDTGDAQDTTLYANVFRPDAAGRFPALVYATAYRRELVHIVVPPNPRWLASQGYAVVLVDIRGTGSSEGRWGAFSEDEVDDMVHLIDNWIPGKDWSNGKVGMYGSSYMGIIQYLAAGRRPEHLKAIFPCASMADAYRDIFYHGGIFDQEFILFWAIGTVAMSLLPPTQIIADPISAIRAFLEHLSHIPEMLSWLEMTADQEFFDIRSPMTHWEAMADLPVFATAGWFGIFTRGSLLNHTNLVMEAERKGAAAGRRPVTKRIVAGPWYHGGGAVLDGLPANDLHKRWFDWHLKADEDPLYDRYDILDPDYPVSLYVMGADQYREERAWPLERAQYRSLYLSGERQAHDQNSSLNNGSLHWTEEIESVWDGADATAPTPLTHNPPVFAGMKSRSSCRWFMGVTSFLPSSEDERQNEEMTLTFSTPVLAEDIEVTGPMVLRFWARTRFGEPSIVSREIFAGLEEEYGVDLAGLKAQALEQDVHWIVNVNDVFPNGRSRNITSGWLAASHRRDPARADWTEAGYDPFDYPEDRSPSPPAEDVLYEYVVEIWPTSNLFHAGHQVRIDIVNSDAPHLLPSYVPSESEILHDREHPSRLILPVVDIASPESNRWIEDVEHYFSGQEPWGE
ncbi:CocE/NonD family hydrolase [Thermodesulfobacteriota bacterium]